MAEMRTTRGLAMLFVGIVSLVTVCQPGATVAAASGNPPITSVHKFGGTAVASFPTWTGSFT
jgi:hypothetical protein